MNFVKVIPFIVLIFETVQGTHNNPVVDLTDGKVEGTFSKSYNGKTYMAFLGIPYAAPPIDNLRFKDPQPVAKWKGTKIANKIPICLQISNSVLIGVEDCLHINVYVPGSEIDCTANLDVIVYIHGGAYMFGSSNSGGPKFLMDRNTILVTFNYRVGVLGFLSTGDKHMSGNYGMKDQVFALKWVRKNIENFGGNPRSVTLHGYSAGASIVHYHYLSPLSRGLFDRGISSSGCALNAWGVETCPLEKAEIIAKSLNCSTYDTKKLADCLRKQCPMALTEATRKLRPWLNNPVTPISVVIDYSSPTPFLPKHPYKILLDKEVYDVPWLSTHVTSEGLPYAAQFWRSKENMEELDKNWCLRAPDVLHYRDVVPTDQMDEVSLKIRHFYLGKKKLNVKSFPNLIRLLDDRIFIADIGLCQKLHAEAVKAPVFAAFYDYISEKKSSLHQLFSNISCHILGPSHGDDIALIYTDNLVPVEKMSKCDEDMKDLLLDMLTAFAEDGHLGIYNWNPILKNKCNYCNQLYIGRQQELRLKKADNMGNLQFWQKLPLMENANLFNNNY